MQESYNYNNQKNLFEIQIKQKPPHEVCNIHNIISRQ